MDSRKEKIKQELNLSDQEYDFLEKYQSMKLSQRFGNVFDRLKNDKSRYRITYILPPILVSFWWMYILFP